jgi:hypothetical protein
MKILALILFSLGLSQVTLSQTVSYVKGKAYQRKDRKRAEIIKGELLSYGAEIQTGRDSYVVISYPSGSRLKIDPRTKIILEKPTMVEQEKQHFVKLKKGALSMFFKKKESGEHLIIEKKSIALAVRGTTFFMGQDGSDLFASVKEGSIAIVYKKNLDYEDVRGGQSIVIEKGRKLTKPASFDWGKQLNWGFEGKILSTGFLSKSLKKARRNEVSKRIGQLRKRVQKRLKGPFQKRFRALESTKRNILKQKKKLKSNIRKKVRDPLGVEAKKKKKARDLKRKLNKKNPLRGLGF